MLRLDRRLRPAIWVFSILLLLAVFRDVLANGRPLYCRLEGQTFYPGLRAMWRSPVVSYGNQTANDLELSRQWRSYRQYEAVLFAPVPFCPEEKDVLLGAQAPGTSASDQERGFRHWLGTDDQGRDVTAGMISGARVALLTGLVAMGIAFSIGLVLGALAGFWGDDRLRVRRGQIWMLLLGLPVAWFYAFIAGPGRLPTAGQWAANLLIFGGIILIFIVSGKWLSRLRGLSKPVVVPADLLVMRSAEIFNALPKFIFLLIVARLLGGNQSIWLMVALIGTFSWPGVASLVRAELLRVRSLDFVVAARALGLTELSVLVRHALPNAIRAAYTAAAIGVASAILLEAALSFLGLSGSGSGDTSWGMLLHSARHAREAWWLALPPGLAICITVLALNKVSEVLGEQRKS